MFKENSEGQTTSADAVEKQSYSMVPTPLSEEDVLNFTSSWNLMVGYSLLDLEGFVFTVENVKKKMNISIDEASVIVESLKDMNLLIPSKDGSFKSLPLVFGESDMSKSDALNHSLKIKRQAIDRLTSKDVFGFQFEALSKQVIRNNFFELYGLLQKNGY